MEKYRKELKVSTNNALKSTKHRMSSGEDKTRPLEVQIFRVMLCIFVVWAVGRHGCVSHEVLLCLGRLLGINPCLRIRSALATGTVHQLAGTLCQWPLARQFVCLAYFTTLHLNLSNNASFFFLAYCQTSLTIINQHINHFIVIYHIPTSK